MQPHIECPKSGQLFRHPFLPSFDCRKSENPRPTNHHQPTPLTPDYSLEKSSRPSLLEAAPLTPPKASRVSKKRKLEDDDQMPDDTNKRRVENWIRSIRPRRTSWPPRVDSTNADTDKEKYRSARSCSCPPRPDNSGSDAVQGQRPLLRVLHEMSQLYRQSFVARSITSSRSPRPGTSNPSYRTILHNNGIHIDHGGANIPQELQEFLNSSILKQQSNPLTPEAIAEVVNTAFNIADSPESNISDLIGTAVLPIKRFDIGRGGNTPWYTDTLPKSDAYGTPPAQPKPDVHCGYPIGTRSSWSIEENAVVDHQQANKITQPAKGNCFPFFVLEMKSEAMGGNIWQAENQAAGSGSCCVNIKRWLYHEAHGTDDQPLIDSIAFSACVTHREVVFHVHHYSKAEQCFYMSFFAAFRTVHEVEACNNVVSNIIKYGLGPRQDKTRQEVKLLYPFPARWKRSRPADSMETNDPFTDQD